MQKEEAKPRRSSSRLILAVLLLVTSGLTLPLASFGAAATSVSAQGTAPRIFIFVIQSPNHSQGKVVLDGVPASFVVAPPTIEGSHQAVALSASGMLHSLDGPSTVVVSGGLNDSSAHACFHVQKLGFVTGPSGEQVQVFGVSPPGLSNGAVLRGGFMGEMMLAPSASMTSSVTAAVPKVWWDFFQRRSKFEIYVEILELMKRGPMTPFEVAFYARLNHKRTKEYTEFLAQAGYLQPVNEDDKILYALTKDGIGFLDRVQTLLVGPGIIEVTSPRVGYQRDF